MDHVAILDKSWGLLDKIVNGEKTIESRWYKTKRPPWDKIQRGETVYFKNSGELISLKATVKEVKQLSDLSPGKVKDILAHYGPALGIEPKETAHYYTHFKDKKYCILIFLTHPQPVAPFAINKKGFGAMSAWLSVANFNRIIAD